MNKNYFYNKSIIYDFENNDTYVKIKIENNKIECKNKIIKKDIEDKIKKININFIIFYVSLYDYELLKKTEYSKTIDILPLNELPIYKKNNDINDFFNWYNKNFNNNEIQVFETSNFIKRKEKFKNDEECKKSVIYEQTNYKHKTYSQLYYHACDNYDLERYGLLYVNTIFNFNSKILKNSIIITRPSIYNTLDYLFNYMKRGILVGIKSNKIALFLPFSKYNYKNDFEDELYFDDDDHKLLIEYKKTKNNKLKDKLYKNVLEFYKKNNISLKEVNLDRGQWMANDCFFNDKKYEGDKNITLYKNLLVELCKERQLNDCIFFMNFRDHPMLRKDNKNAYSSITDKKIPEKYISGNLAPIFSAGASTNYLDIPMITADDWLRITQQYFPDECKNGYIIENNIIELNWNNKKPVAIFRGSATGCGITEKDNMRYKASIISQKYPELLDAGLTSFNIKPKKQKNSSLQVIDTKNINKASFINNNQKSKYKYILNIDGHVSAFRLGYEFSLKSVVLLQQTEYYLWFTHLLIPYENYIPIKNDLSDLIDIIKWCIDNDDKCKKIASNGFDFYNKYLTKEGALNYMQSILNKMYLINEPLKTKKSIAIIIPYRDNIVEHPNLIKHSRLKQKRLYQYFMSKLINENLYCDFKIIIVEQTYKDIFNIGKLKNVGFDYLNKNKLFFDNYIFSDVDMIPSTKLIPYFLHETNGFISLARYGTRYEQIVNAFLGGCISCSKKTFERVNGYSLLFSRGWGGEDNNLIYRCYKEDITIYTPARDAVIIDIEEINGRPKTTFMKKEELKLENNYDMQRYEIVTKYDLYKEDGLSNMTYNLLDKFTSDIIIHLIVDLDQQNHEKKYPSHYDFTGYTSDFGKKIHTLAQLVKKEELIL